MKIPNNRDGIEFRIVRDKNRYFEWVVFMHYYNSNGLIQVEKLNVFLTRLQARVYVKKLMEKYGNSSARVQDIISAEKQEFIP